MKISPWTRTTSAFTPAGSIVTLGALLTTVPATWSLAQQAPCEARQKIISERSLFSVELDNDRIEVEMEDEHAGLNGLVPRASQRSSAAEWRGLRKAQNALGYSFVAMQDGTWFAGNAAQQWITHFDGQGFTTSPDGEDWSWGLALESWGRTGHTGAIGKSTQMAGAGTLRYGWNSGVEEWFVNDSRGLEQGWTIQKPPSATAARRPATRCELVLNLTVRGGLAPRLEPSAQSITFLDSNGNARITYGGLKAWDATGSALGARFEVQENDETRIQICVKDSGARYPITIDPVAQQAYLKASNAEASDRFGSAVAASGNTLVIGAPLEDSSGTGSGNSQSDNSKSSAGAAYVFVRNGGNWTQQAYLKASNADAGDSFGWAVGISSDTIAVGAYLESSSATTVNGLQTDNSAAAAGAVYVFTRSGTTWTQQAYLKPATSQAGDWFGYSVAVSGNTLVAGAPYEDSGSSGVNGNATDNSLSNAGAAYVFLRTGGTWEQQAYLKASGPGPDFFGWSVAADGDSVIVSAPWEDSNAATINGDDSNNTVQNSGAAYLFKRTGSIWAQQAYLKPSNTGFSDFFGWSVGLSGNLAVVGALEEDSNATGVDGLQSNNDASNSGAAYVFGRTGTTWRQQAYLKASNTGVNDSFGQSVVISGRTLVVGANKEDSNATGMGGNGENNDAADSGAAYVFVREKCGWIQQAYLKPANTETGDSFGIACALTGSTVVVGADREDSNATTVGGSQGNNSASEAGASYVFVGLGAPALEIVRTAPSVTLRWPTDADGWRLEASDNLRAGSWLPLGASAVAQGNWKSLELPLDRSRRFFRLR